MRRISLLGSVIAAALVTSLAAPAQAAVATELVPFRIDASNQAGWWQPIEEWGGRAYVAYNAWGGPSAGGATDTHIVYIARREADGTWTRGCLKAATGGCVVYRDDVGHNQPSIAIDGDGYLHAFVSMHSTGWRYYRSTAPGDVTSMINRSAQLPDQDGRYTYPNVTRVVGGDLYLIIRAIPEGRLYRWDNATDTWSRVATFAAATNHVVYPDDVIGDRFGNVHIAWEWAYGGTNALRHLASYLRYSPATNQFFTASGAPVAAPATPTSPVVYQPLERQERATDRDDETRPPGVQSAKLAISPATGRPMAAYRYRSAHGYPWRVRLAEWTGTTWRRQIVYGGAYDTTAAVDITGHGAGIRVYYAKAQTQSGDQAFTATRQANGSWAETLLLPRVRVERLAVIRRGATDHLYLAAPGARQEPVDCCVLGRVGDDHPDGAGPRRLGRPPRHRQSPRRPRPARQPGKPGHPVHPRVRGPRDGRLLPILTALLAGATLLGGLTAVGISLVVITIVLVVALRFGRYVSMVVDSPEPEVFLLRVLGAALLVAGIASQLQVSAAVGAFLLGIAISGATAENATKLLEPLRDLFAAMFFVVFGLNTDPTTIPPVLVAALLLALVTTLTKVATGWWAAQRQGIGRRVLHRDRRTRGHRRRGRRPTRRPGHRLRPAHGHPRPPRRPIGRTGRDRHPTQVQAHADHLTS